MFKNILFATDGSPASEHAATLAVSLARTHGAALTAVYVVDPYPYLGVGDMNPMGFQAYMGAAQAHSVKAFAQVEEIAKADGADVAVETILAEDVVAYKGILQAAESQKSDLIILGSHGRNGLEKLFLGSTANKVTSHAKIPVLITR